MQLHTDVLQHKGCFGSVESSSEDGCLFGRLLSIRALVSYEGQNLIELKMLSRKQSMIISLLVDALVTKIEIKLCRLTPFIPKQTTQQQ